MGEQMFRLQQEAKERAISAAVAADRPGHHDATSGTTSGPASSEST